MKELKKYLNTKGLWSFWFLVAVSAVVIYVVAQQTGLALEAFNNNDVTGLTVKVGKPATTKTPNVPAKPVTRY